MIPFAMRIEERVADPVAHVNVEMTDADVVMERCQERRSVGLTVPCNGTSQEAMEPASFSLVPQTLAEKRL